jgi:BON domain
MNETIFGSATPVWTAMPSIPLAYQPMSVSNRPIAAPLFSSTAIPAGIGSALTGAGLSAQQTVAGSGYVAPYPFAAHPASALPGQDVNGLVTASSLLTAVAQRRGQPQGPVNDHEVEEFIYDALDLLPGTADVEVRSENGRVTLTGVVQHKRTKRDIGEIAWALPGLQDVQNNVSITSRRRGRAGREAETPAASARKQG